MNRSTEADTRAGQFAPEPAPDAAERREAILSLLDDDLAIQERHLTLLQEQKEALVDCDRGWFALLHERGELLLSDLEMQHRRRLRLFSPAAAGENKPPLRAEIEAWPEPQRAGGLALAGRLVWVAKRVEEQAAQNQTLIGNDLRFVNFELSLILSAVSRGPHYLKNGAPMQLQANRLFNQTV